MDCPPPSHGLPSESPLAVMEWYSGTGRAFRFAVGKDCVILGSALGTDIRLGIKDPPLLAWFRHDGKVLYCRILAPQCPLRLNGVLVSNQTRLQVNDRLEIAGQTALVVHVALGLTLSEKVTAPELVAFAQELESQAILVDQWHKSLELRESELNHRESQMGIPKRVIPMAREPLPCIRIQEIAPTPSQETIPPQGGDSHLQNPPQGGGTDWNPPSSWEEGEDSWEFLAYGEIPTPIIPTDPGFTRTESDNSKSGHSNQDLNQRDPAEDLALHALDQERWSPDPNEEVLSKSVGVQQEPIFFRASILDVGEVQETESVQPFHETIQNEISTLVTPLDFTIPLGDYLCADCLTDSDPVEAMAVANGARVFLEAKSDETTPHGAPLWEHENLPRDLGTYQHNNQKYQVWEISKGPFLLALELAPILGIWYHLILQTTLGVRALHEAGRSLGSTKTGWVVLDPSGLVKLRGPGLRGTDQVGDLEAIGQLARNLWSKAFGAYAPPPEFIKNLLARLGSQSEEISRIESLEQLSGELDRVGLRIRNNPYAFAALLQKTFPDWKPPSSRRISA